MAHKLSPPVPWAWGVPAWSGFCFYPREWIEATSLPPDVQSFAGQIQAHFKDSTTQHIFQNLPWAHVPSLHHLPSLVDSRVWISCAPADTRISRKAIRFSEISVGFWVLSGQGRLIHCCFLLCQAQAWDQEALKEEFQERVLIQSAPLGILSHAMGLNVCVPQKWYIET